MSKRNRFISAKTLMRYDLAIMQAVMDDALEEQHEVTRSYTQVVERMNHLIDNLDDALGFMSVGSTGFAGFEEFAISLY